MKYTNGVGSFMFSCVVIAGEASDDEISQAVKDWYAKNPGYKGDGAKIFALMKSALVVVSLAHLRSEFEVVER